ncbi:T9SS type A sorting domain-containing protein [Telluribacter sp.]|jgi:hypothetical protein|uniref:T9SS type A sorting domain-containing protein n=1 Tax=Telluribacter sp. TaxID=1978767 RepID=UPI002E1483F9|nr:T9SS type A sorting domain-containing protein [Telluribacter sp.]
MKQLCLLALLVCFSVLGSSLPTFATHILGGTIQTRHLSGLTYEIRTILYLDQINGRPASDAQVEVKICTGDGRELVLPYFPAESGSVNNQVRVGIYKGTYTFAGPGQYTLSASLMGRTNLTNIPQPGPERAAYLFTTLNTSLPNSTATLPTPVFEAGIRQVYTYSLSASDPDGDSLAYRPVRLLQPNQNGLCGPYRTVDRYQFPNEVAREGTFAIRDKVLTWNAPTQVGSYAYAFLVEEWRNGIKIAETLLESVVLVSDKAGTPVAVPPFQPVEFGDFITALPPQEFLPGPLSVLVYPVPSQEWITVEVQSRRPSFFQIQLLDLQGRILQQVQFQEPSVRRLHRFRVEALPPGNYLILVNDKQETVTKKLVR